MKKITYLLAFCSMLTVACNNEPPKQENKNLLPTDLVNNPRSAEGTDAAAMGSLASMSFRDSVFDFGSINEGEIVKHEFEFTNNGKSPLIISNAVGSCGCTVADFPREPLAPGKSADIKVEFHSAGKHGHQEKSITLTTNTARGTYMLFIKGEVKDKS